MQEKSSIGKIRDLFQLDESKRDLPYILSLADPSMNAEKKLEWLGMLRAWIVAPLTEGQKLPGTRIRFILQLLERHPDWAENVKGVLRSMLQNCQAFSCFAYLGLFEEKGFADQVAGLMLEKVLPLPNSPQDLTEWIEYIFPDRDDADWVENLAPNIMEDLLRFLGKDEGHTELFSSFYYDMLAACRVLALQVASMGITPSLWMRLGSPTLSLNPFWRFECEISSLCGKLEVQKTVDVSEANLDALRVNLKSCEVAMAQAFTYLQTHGVNTGLVLRLEHIQMHLKRLELFIGQLEAIKNGHGETQGLKVLAELIRARYDAKNFNQLLKGNLQMLSLRVVEHTGTSGEHYITRSRSEYFSMLRSAAGGGFLTVGTTLLKYGIGKLMLPPFGEAILSAGNYALSFLTMQALHFTLATKQPSMTAAALANKIMQSRGKNNGLAIAIEIRNIVRSQFAAILGNIGLAVPTALLFSYLFALIQGRHFFDTAYAEYSIDSLHPIRTFSLFYAAQTGVLLWLSSLVAGWFENWLAFQRVPERIKRNQRIKRAFGPEAGVRMSGFVSRNISGITGNVVLGLFLAGLPFLGKISGLPLDIRHVTLSSASLAISAVSLGDKVVPLEVVMAALGVVCIGILNFSVSFYLALSVARFAQNINDRMFVSIQLRVAQLFKLQPLSFFYPRNMKDVELEKLPFNRDSGRL